MRTQRGYHSLGHTLNVAGGYIFINSAYASDGLYVLDVQTTPRFPRLVARWSGGDAHDTFFISGLTVPGLSGPRDLLYSSDGRRSNTQILDMTNARGFFLRPTLQLQPIGTTNTISGHYSHSSAVTNDGQVLYAFDESNRFDLAIYDLSDPRDPQFVKYFQYSNEGAENSYVHNGRIRGNYLYVAYYTAGLRVFDISDRFNPVEVGKFETFRDPDGDGQFEKPFRTAFDGAWNVYVDLPSGNVLVSDTDEGLFIFGVSEQ